MGVVAMNLNGALRVVAPVVIDLVNLYPVIRLGWFKLDYRKVVSV